MADKNYQSYYGEKNLIVAGRVFPNAGIEPKEYDDILKFSECETVSVDGCIVYAGKENCIDAVRGKDYTVIGTTLLVRQPALGAFTIKGAIDGFDIVDCAFDGHGSKFDVELGQYDDYWYPGRPPTKNVKIINCHATDGLPIKVQLWNAEAPQVIDTDAKVTYIPWLVWFPYFFAKYVVRKVKSIF